MSSSLKNRFPPILKNPTYSVKKHSQQFEKEIVCSDPRAQRALVALMDMEATLGGAASHYGGPAAFAEILSALYALMVEGCSSQKKQWHECFQIVNDAGHCENGLYALRANYEIGGMSLESLKGFRSIESDLTGHFEAHLLPEQGWVSNGPLGSSVAPAQGLCMADAAQGNKDKTTILLLSDGACYEGEAKEALCSIPAMAQKSLMAPFVCVLSDNEVKLSGPTSQAFSLDNYLSSLSQYGWEIITIEKGNDLSCCIEGLEKALQKVSSQSPIFVRVKTKKGYGSSATENHPAGAHGFPCGTVKELEELLKEIYPEPLPKEWTNWIQELCKKEEIKKEKKNQKMEASNSNSNSNSLLSQKKEKIQVGVSRALIEKRKAQAPLVSITSDLYGSTGAGGFIKEFPKDTYDMGVAESNMISVATGFSLKGFIPVVDTFAQFGMTKGSLPFIISALSEAPMIALFSHTGFQDAADGASHQSLSYLAIASALPNVKAVHLSCSEEAYELLSQAIDDIQSKKEKGAVASSYLFFMGRENFPSSFGVKKYSLNSAQIIFDNSDKFSDPVLVLPQGSLLEESIKAALQREEKDQKATIILHQPCLDFFDEKLFIEKLKLAKGKVIITEDHWCRGGMASLFSQWCAERSLPLSLKSLSVKELGRSAYQSIDLYQKYGLDSEAIYKSF